jgi:hypothetical protein
VCQVGARPSDAGVLYRSRQLTRSATGQSGRRDQAASGLSAVADRDEPTPLVGATVISVLGGGAVGGGPVDEGLARRLKALACTAPLHDLDARKARLDWADASAYQMAEIALQIIDQVTIVMDFDHGADHDQVVARTRRHRPTRRHPRVHAAQVRVMNDGLSVRASRLAALVRAWPRIRVPLLDLWRLLDQADPASRMDAGRRTTLAGLLTELADAGVISLPSARSFDRTERPPLPRFVTVPRPDAEMTKPPDVLWHPALCWVPDTRLTPSQLDTLVAINTWLFRSRDDLEVPVRERSLEIFGDEKALDRLLLTTLFGPDRLSLPLLRARRATPRMFTQTVGDGDELLVAENSDTVDSLTRALTGRPGPIGVVGWGPAPVRGIRTVHHRPRPPDLGNPLLRRPGRQWAAHPGERFGDGRCRRSAGRAPGGGTLRGIAGRRSATSRPILDIATRRRPARRMAAPRTPRSGRPPLARRAAPRPGSRRPGASAPARPLAQRVASRLTRPSSRSARLRLGSSILPMLPQRWVGLRHSPTSSQFAEQSAALHALAGVAVVFRSIFARAGLVLSGASDA